MPSLPYAADQLDPASDAHSAHSTFSRCGGRRRLRYSSRARGRSDNVRRHVSLREPDRPARSWRRRWRRWDTARRHEARGLCSRESRSCRSDGFGFEEAEDVGGGGESSTFVEQAASNEARYAAVSTPLAPGAAYIVVCNVSVPADVKNGSTLQAREHRRFVQVRPLRRRRARLRPPEDLPALSTVPRPA